jgi:hypothetical protein
MSSFGGVLRPRPCTEHLLSPFFNEMGSLLSRLTKKIKQGKVTPFVFENEFV